MLKYRVNVNDEIISSEIAMTTFEVCPICGEPSESHTGLCKEHFNQFAYEIDYYDTLDSFINREISIRKSFPKHFI
jgi:hypothetical protein